MKEKLGLVALFWVLITTSIFTIMALWTDRSLEFWLGQYKGEPVEVSLAWSFFLNLTGPCIFFGNIVSEIARLVV